MKPFLLTSTLIATLCLTADYGVVLECENDSLKNTIILKYPSCIPPFLVACKGWDKDLAMAFAAGLVLGKLCEKQEFNRKETNGQGKEKECDILTFDIVDIYKTDVQVNLIMGTLNKAISANLEWKEKDKIYNPFSELFDIQSVQKAKMYLSYITLENVRRVFVKYAKNATAVIAIDVAILKWLLHAINAKPKDYHIVGVEGPIIMPICALSMHPKIGEYLTNDILTVLTQMEYYTDTECSYYKNVDFLTSSLITVVKMLEDGPIRTKVVEMVAKMYPVVKRSYLDCRMLLGSEHSIVKHMEERIEDEVISNSSSILQQLKCDKKLHTMSFSFFDIISQNLSFSSVWEHRYLIATIETDSTLIWEETTPKFEWEVSFINKSDSHPRQMRLFIFSQLPVPDNFWKIATSCSSLPMFEEILKTPIVKRMIITYGISIFESSFEIK